MSSDLLAEFDSFYRAPQVESSSRSATNAPKSSALDDLSFFGGHNDHKSKSLEEPRPATQLNKNGDEWEDFSGFKLGTPSQVQQTDPDLDGWGDFEDAEPAVIKGDLLGNHTTSFGDDPSVSDSQKHTFVKPGIVRVSTADLFANSISDLAESSARRGNNMSHTYSTYTPPLPKPAKFPPPAENVLFDAEYELEEDDDDFGDFETVLETDPEAAKPPDGSTLRKDLLEDELPAVKDFQQSKRPPQLSSTAFTSNSFPYPQAPKSPSFQERNPFADLALRTKGANIKEDEKVVRKADSPVTAWPIYEPTVPKPAPYVDSPILSNDSTDWGDFEDLPPTIPPADSKPQKPVSDKNRVSKQRNSLLGITIASAQNERNTPDDPWAWNAADEDGKQTKSAPAEDHPPINIPPPSVLLTIFPQLLNLSETSLFTAVTNQSNSLKNRIMSDPATIDFLRAYVLLSVVAAHLIAGRKLRWKRDAHLSQGMSIGPAGGGKSGMKLTGLDKTESIREDRETSELVRIWKEQIGRLRSAVAIANSSIQDKSAQLIIPEMNETMPVKSVSMAEGGLTAPKACILCGLKRDERVGKVDLQVEDSFGEWWIEHWGHRSCRNFWQQHESKLKQR